MGVRDDCKHYLLRTTAAGDSMQRCRLSANDESPFSCPDSCLFFEARALSGAGWTPAPTESMSNTARGLDGLGAAPKRRRGKRRRG